MLQPTRAWKPPSRINFTQVNVQKDMAHVDEPDEEST